MVTFSVFARLTNESNEEMRCYQKKSLLDLVTFSTVARLIDRKRNIKLYKYEKSDY